MNNEEVNRRSMNILIRNGRIINGDKSFDADIRVQNGIITEVGVGLEPKDNNTAIIDASRCYVLPGGIDPHVHMELPIAGGLFSSDTFETGTRAAVAGGTTTIIDFVTPQRNQSLFQAFQLRKEIASGSLCDFGLHMSVTGWNEQIPSELAQSCDSDGISSVKLYMAYKESIGLNDDIILDVMEAAAELDMLVMVHCEDGETIRGLQKKFISRGNFQPRFHPLSRPPETEAEAVKRAVLMAEAAGCRLYIVHVSAAPSIAEIRSAQQRGLPVFAETCPHYLLLDDREYSRPDFSAASYVLSPPLREKHHQEVLWQAIIDNTIRVVSTDHCPFNLEGQKDRGKNDFTLIPNGAGSVEHRLMLLYRYGVLAGKISHTQWVNLVSTQPAKLFGLFPRKGIIAEGSDADIVVWDPGTQDTISAGNQFQNCDNTIYEGFPVTGKPHTVICRGIISYTQPHSFIHKAPGHYLHRFTPNSSEILKTTNNRAAQND